MFVKIRKLCCNIMKLTTRLYDISYAAFPVGLYSLDR